MNTQGNRHNDVLTHSLMPISCFSTSGTYFLSEDFFVLFCFSLMSREKEHIQLPPENQVTEKSGVSIVVIIAESKQ